METLRRFFAFWLHELFTGHDPRVVKRKFIHGRRLADMDCSCGAEWYDIDFEELMP